MLSWILAIFVFILGAKAFTKDGIPLTRTKKLQGTGGMICGILCMLLGLVFVLDGLLWLSSAARLFSR
jgi:MFS superfamily sulfate permease-like transporter